MFFYTNEKEKKIINNNINNCNHLKHELKFIKNIKDNNDNFQSEWECPDCGRKILRDYGFIQGEVSDGYHTFNELYHHRAVLFATICNKYKDLAWKSLKHDDNTMYDNMFIVGIKTPKGQATYHYDINPYWDTYFKNIKVLPKAPKYDGHTPEEAINRIFSLTEI